MTTPPTPEKVRDLCADISVVSLSHSLTLCGQCHKSDLLSSALLSFWKLLISFSANLFFSQWKQGYRAV